MIAAWVWPAWVWPVIAAPFAGSVAGVMIRRLPAGRPVALARSVCESCGRPLGPQDMVPLASFAVLRGRCRTCGARIAWFHPAVELAALAVAVWAAQVDRGPLLLWADCFLGWTLLALAWIDWEHMILPDALTLPLVLTGLGFTYAIAPSAIGASALGAASGYLALRGIALAYRRLRGREGLGEGDAKLLAASGAWLGWAGLPLALLIAGITGIAAALGQMLIGRRIDRSTAMPFGPFLALGTWLVWLYGGG